MNESSQKKQGERAIRNQLRAQMEFYFSDSNLSKDRYLKQKILLSKEGYVDLSIFLQFNKIRTLTSNLKLLTKSLKKSDLLELNVEKSMVKRKNIYSEPELEDTNKKTIYVENLPSRTTLDILKKHFEEKFGTVSYISLPKFKSSHHLKGFSFIEFSKKKYAKKAIKYYASSNEFDIVGKFPKSHKIITDLQKKIKNVEELIQNFDAKSKYPHDSAYRIPEDNNIKISSPDEFKKLKVCKKSTLNNINVFPKKKWLESKLEYLTQQKMKIVDLKKKLASLNELLQKKISGEDDFNTKISDIDKGCVIKLILSPNDPEFAKVFKLTKQKFKSIYFQNKEDLKYISYVDIEKNNNRILIRCNSRESANMILNNNNILNQFSKSIIDGLEENEYLKKINSNRIRKLNKKVIKKVNNIQMRETDLTCKPIQSTRIIKNDLTSENHIIFNNAYGE